MTVLAHPGHWLVDAAYVLPVAAFLVWLAINEVRTRRRRRAESGDGPPEGGQLPGAAPASTPRDP